MERQLEYAGSMIDRNVAFLTSCLVSLALLPACDSGEKPAGGSAAAPTGTQAAASKGAPTTTAATAAVPAAKGDDAPKLTLVEKDLSKAGDKFKGWVAKGPADADVMEDLGGARIATKKVMGPGSFDLAFKLEKRNLKETKEALQKGSEMAKTTLTFTTDTAEALEWTTTMGSSKSYDFVLLQKADGKDATCYTVTPRESEAEIATLKEACKSLAKK